MTITIVIADDHHVVRSGVRGFLNAHDDLEVVAEAANGAEAVRLVSDLAPDVALIDLVMPGMAGIEAIAEIHRVSPRTQIIVLTSYHDDSHIFPAIKAGASSYLLKEVAPDALVAAVRAAARGEPTLSSQVAARLIAETRSPRLPDDPGASLTVREHEVLRLVAEGCSNADIAERLVLSEKTVKGHVSNILGKLHLGDRTQAAIFAWREGLIERDR